jgi:hypothetical protein
MSTFARFVVAFLLGTSLLAPSGAFPSSPLLDCAALPGLTPNVWQGAGVDPDADDQWENDANWSLGTAPVRLDNPYVCIPAGGTPTIRTGQEARLIALDVSAGGELTVDRGGALFLYGDALTPSTIRGRLEVVGAAFGGPGQVEVSGALHVRSLGPSDPASISTGTCALVTALELLGDDPCPAGGRIVVADEGVVDVSGGRVDVNDQFRITVRGLLRVHDDGFLAADHGTRLELLPHSGPTAGTGTLRFEGDGDYVEGSDAAGPDELGTVVNQGLIVKSGGTGTSLLTATYSQPSPGTVTVDSGTLLLPSGSPTPAAVAGGGGYGSGRCLSPGRPGCLAQTFGLDRQNAQFQVPTEDSSGASVVIDELSTASSAADIGFPVEAHATGLSASAAAPAILSLRYDERILNGRGWTSINIFRRADDAAPYVALQPCLANGDQPVGQVACVDRRGLPGSSRNVVDAEGNGTAPDVIMVVRTVDTSRWVAR